MRRLLPILALLLLALPAHADIAIVGTVTGQNGTGTSSTIISSASASFTDGNTLLVGVTASGETADVMSIGDTRGAGQNSYSRCNASYVGAAGRFAVWYYSTNIGGGTFSVLATMDTSVAYRSINVIEVSGVKTTSPCETGAVNSCTSCNSVTSASFSPGASGNLNVGLANISADPSSWTQDGNYTALTTLTPPPGHASEYRLSAPAGAQTAAMTANGTTNQSMVISVASFLPEPAGGPNQQTPSGIVQTQGPVQAPGPLQAPASVQTPF